MANSDETVKLEDKFKEVNINNKNLVDITDIFNKFKNDLVKEDPNKVFKSSLFDLFSSTSALEVNSPNLDSSLIVAENDKKYDTSFSSSELKKVLNLNDENDSIFVLLDYILRSFINWIKDNGSLTTNFISIKYIEEILNEYTTSLQIKKTFNSDDWLVDDILRLSIISLIFIVKNLSMNCSSNAYVCEEEDIRFDSLGLNFLSEHDFANDVKNDYKEAVEKITHKPLKSICHFIYMFTDFLDINMSMDSLDKEIVLFDDIKDAFAFFKTQRDSMNDVIRTANIPSNLKTYLPQRTYSNAFPKKKIPVLPSNNYDVIENIIATFETTIPLLSKENKLVGADLTEKMYYIFTNQFQYYYDDYSLENNFGRICPLNRIFFLARFVNLDMSCINDVKIMKHITEDIKSVLFINEETENVLLSDEQLMDGPMAVELQSVHQVYIDSLLSKLRNQCQYRQAFSKQLLYWDSAQANIGQFEDPYPTDLANNLDKFPAISLWTYHQKLNSMVEFLLRGFALNIYSEWEFFAVYWNAYNIISENYSLITQFQTFNKLLLLRYETQNLNKNLKKKHKDAAKRARIKERNLNYIEQLTKKINTLSNKLVETEILSLLCFVQCLRYIQLLMAYEHKDKVLQFLKEDSSSASYIYEVRFKAFESIGSPQLPKNGIGHVLDSFLKGENFDTYLSNSLTKLKDLKTRLSTDNGDDDEIKEKKDYWERVNNSIDNFSNVYTNKNIVRDASFKSLEFFKLYPVDQLNNDKMHEFFPTLL